MDNKYLTVKKEGFFKKIKSFFMRLFNREEIIEEPVVENFTNNEQLDKKKSFAEEIKVKEDTEKTSLLKMQKDYEDGKLLEENMSAEQVSKLEKLYTEQITKLRQDYTSYKQKIVSMRKKVSQSNN